MKELFITSSPKLKHIYSGFVDSFINVEKIEITSNSKLEEIPESTYNLRSLKFIVIMSNNIQRFSLPEKPAHQCHNRTFLYMKEALILCYGNGSFTVTRLSSCLWLVFEIYFCFIYDFTSTQAARLFQRP